MHLAEFFLDSSMFSSVRTLFNNSLSSHLAFLSVLCFDLGVSSASPKFRLTTWRRGTNQQEAWAPKRFCSLCSGWKCLSNSKKKIKLQTVSFVALKEIKQIDWAAELKPGLKFQSLQALSLICQLHRNAHLQTVEAKSMAEPFRQYPGIAVAACTNTRFEFCCTHCRWQTLFVFLLNLTFFQCATGWQIVKLERAIW